MASMPYRHTRKHATPSLCDQWTLRNSFGEDKMVLLLLPCPRFGQRKLLKREDDFQIWEMQDLRLKAKWIPWLKKKNPLALRLSEKPSFWYNPLRIFSPHRCYHVYFRPKRQEAHIFMDRETWKGLPLKPTSKCHPQNLLEAVNTNAFPLK